MQVGRSHEWNYPNGKWKETKVAPDRWEFAFSSTKTRNKPAPVGSGCDLGTQYHWLIVGNQYVRKVDADTYETMMKGLKFKVGYRKPYWRKWSYEYIRQEERENTTDGYLTYAMTNGF